VSKRTPIAFKVRTQGQCDGSKGGKASGAKGGAGAIWYEDKAFTLARTQDQWLCTDLATNNYTHQSPPMTTPQVPLRFLSCCSGIEAASVAWDPLGFKPVGYSEIEPFPCAVLAHRFPSIKNYGDLTQHTTWNIEPGTVDLLVAGTPCQAFSTAGLRQGLSDPRGNLALVILSLLDRLQCRYFLWENVPGVLSSNGGTDFGSFIGALAELGYGFAWRICNAEHFGVPQRRKRVFLLAVRGAGGWRTASEILFESQSLPGNSLASREEGEATASSPFGSFDASGVPRTVGAICADAHPGSYSGQDAYTGRLIPALPTIIRPSEARLQGGLTARSVCPTITSEHHGGDHAPVAITKSPAFPINTLTMGGRPDAKNDLRMTMGVGNDGDPQFTLQAHHSHAVATPMAVRRLTPMETERLQGFPDGWTDIPWKGQPGSPDSLRYKACGNSMAVPVVRWIGARIARHEASRLASAGLSEEGRGNHTPPEQHLQQGGSPA
jgi:DNA (cytosine-5)-methyltransferase 1